MQFALSDEQQMIRDAARTFFAEYAGSERLRAAIESSPGYDPELWQRLAAESGWAGIAIAERYGGAGLGMVELALLQHEQGRRLVASPYFSTVCLAAPLIAQAGTEQQRAEWLPRVAAGDARLAVACANAQGATDADRLTVRIRPQADAFALSGEAVFVIHAHSCDALLVAARGPGDEAARALSIAVVARDAPGLTIEPLTMLDLTRPMSRVTLAAVRVGRDRVLGEPGGALDAFERVLDLARIALAAEAVGVAEAALEMTTAYVKDRVQFGRPVGSFQAVKHRLADMMVAVEAARSASWYAACVADEVAAELPEAASIAKAACSDAAFECAANAIQLHGGIGFTWEHDAHLYFKRARAISTLLGTPAWHRERLAGLIGLGAGAGAPAW
jgi:alkylation response protein AidB-like acyl-CoA dehydrogenase